MMSQRAKVIEGGKLVLPAKLRRAAGIEPGDTVTVELEGGVLRVLSLRAQIERMQAMAKALKPAGGASVVDEFIAGKRAEVAREDAEEAQWLAGRDVAVHS
jgi:bifunctional DNA-binding transcriptional regulator/antitoxin component of YhaV-PrlF toxin-antitoxin module